MTYIHKVNKYSVNYDNKKICSKLKHKVQEEGYTVWKVYIRTLHWDPEGSV